jgi:Flp pilus assembly pilin Flp
VVARCGISTRRWRGDGGAALAEYALGFALIAVVSVGGIQRLNDASKAEAANQADCISERPPPPSCVRRPVPAPQPPSGEPGDPPTTDTTYPTSTDPPPTTAPPPPPPPPSEIAPGDVVATWNDDGTWGFVYELTITDPDGRPIDDATVEGRVLIQVPDGVPQGFTVSCSPVGNGVYQCAFDGIPPEIGGVRFDIFRVNANPPAEPPFPSVVIDQPAPEPVVVTTV